MSATESLKDAATYAALRTKLAWLTHQVHVHADTVTQLASDVDETAEQMQDASETMKALAVDGATIAEFADAALTMTGAKDAAGAYTAAADGAAAAADDAKTTVESDHGGIADAVDTSPSRWPKPPSTPSSKESRTMGPTRAQFIQYAPAALAVASATAGPWSALAAAAAGAGAWAIDASVPTLRSLIACGITATGCGIAAHQVLASGMNPLFALGLAVPAGAAVLAHHRNTASGLPALPATTTTGQTSQAQLITAWWKEFISGPTQTEGRKLIQAGAGLAHLVLDVGEDHASFTGVITLPQGQQVRVKAADIAAVYQIPVSQVEMGDPKHYAPNALPITVHLKKPSAAPQIAAAGAPATPEELWAAHVAVPEGAMPGTTLTLTRYDGPLDWEGIATRARRAIGTVNIHDLAGNLDLETIQIALAPTDKPSQMGVRVMREHALMHGTMLSSVVDELAMDSRGYVRLGTYIDARAALVPWRSPVPAPATSTSSAGPVPGSPECWSRFCSPHTSHASR